MSTNRLKKTQEIEEKSCKLSYEFVSNFKDRYNTFYTTSTGEKAKEEVDSLTWAKEINYHKNLIATIISINGESGIAEHKIKVVVKKDGKCVGSPITVTANESGSFSTTNPSVVFFKN